MSKVAKGIKHKCRVRPVKQEKLEKLYEKINIQCQDCMNDCKNEIENNKNCLNRKDREYELNEIIQILKEENINMTRFCEDYTLKLDWLIEMLRGNKILSYKYYTCFMDRIGEIKNNIEINLEYQQLSKKDGVDI